MLTKCLIEKVIIELKDQGYFPEYDKILQIIEDMKNYIREFILGSLNEDEKKLVEIYNLQLKSGQCQCNSIYCRSICNLSYYFDSTNNINRYFNYTSHLRTYGINLSAIDLETKEHLIIPIVFNDWESFYKKYPEDYVKIENMFKELDRYCKSYAYKTRKLLDLLSKKEVGLTVLKKEFPLIYNIVKK